MCTIAVLFGVAESPLILAANRDELYARPTRPPERLGPRLIGGVDVIGGGTWMAVREDGQFAAVTNQRALDQTPKQGLRSRGQAVRELADAADQDAYVRALDATQYASMNLVWGNAERVSVAYCRVDGSKEVVALSRGVHVMCNDRIGAPGFPRCERMRRAIDSALAESKAWPHLAQRLATGLADHTRVEPEPSHLPPDVARELTATCIHTPHYGTRSATIVAIDRGKVQSYLYADGAPCVTPFLDRTVLFQRKRTLVVAGLIVGDDRRVLITQRTADQALPLQWEFPGGKVEPGEDPKVALARELHEELGVRVDVGRVWDVLFHAYPDFDLVMPVYACRITGGEPRAVEVADFAWVETGALGAWDILPADRPLVDRLAAEGPPI